jgi:hypothetical protein
MVSPPKASTGFKTPRSAAASGTLAKAVATHSLRKILLACGVAAPVWWVAMDVVGSLRYAGYSFSDQTISELSAEGAPTRAFMLAVSGIPYAALMIVFGVGVWLVAGRWSRAGRVVGALLIVEAVFGFVGGILFPMATREVLAAGEETLRNRLHAPYGIGMPILFIAVTIFGSRLFGKRFRWYSYATILVTLVFGFWMSLQTSQMLANEPTPWLGIKERVTAYVPMIWIAVLAVALLRAKQAQPEQERHSAGT